MPFREEVAHSKVVMLAQAMLDQEIGVRALSVSNV